MNHKCEHQTFDASVEVNRVLGDGDGEPPIRFTVDVAIRCRDCGLPFRFIGLPHGLDMNGAAVSANGEEARLCIAPQGEVLTMVDGVTGFTARRTQ